MLVVSMRMPYNYNPFNVCPLVRGRWNSTRSVMIFLRLEFERKKKTGDQTPRLFATWPPNLTRQRRGGKNLAH